jgi:hypothetical protein
MNPDNVSNSLGNWEVFELVCEKDESAVADPSICLIDNAALICNFHGANILVTFEALMRELGIQYGSIKVAFVGATAFIKITINVRAFA